MEEGTNGRTERYTEVLVSSTLIYMFVNVNHSGQI